MANNFGDVRLIGVEDLLVDIEKYEANIQALVAAEIRASAQKIVRDAKRNVSNQRGSDQGRLVQLISERSIAKTTRQVISGAEYSAFAEFGTKSRVSIPSELQEFARQFKGMKLPTASKMSFRQAIYEWARRKGIAKEYWWFIYQSIKKFGRYAKPFFFPAYFAEIVLLRKRLTEILNT